VNRRGERRRIVVVDDDIAVLKALQRQLDTLGWDVHPAASAEEALSTFRRLGGVEVLLTDVDMPVMDGVALRAEVVRRFPGTAVVFMSGGAGPSCNLAADPSTAVLLRKPFTRQALAAVLDAAVEPTGSGQE
jgi:FixJ family two-component response regulator